MFSGSFGVRSIVLCKCSGKVLIGYYFYITPLAYVAYSYQDTGKICNYKKYNVFT